MKNNIKEKRLLTPKYDVIFQALFGVKGSEEILGELLSSLLGRKVENVQLNENQILTKEYPNEKLGILDLIANINNNETVNIEIQLKNQYNMSKRILYYWSRIYGKKITTGEDYKELNKTISIMLINYELEELNKYKDAHTIWKMKEARDTSIDLFDDIEIHIVEMPKVLKYNETNKKLKNWIQFILDPESEGTKMSIQEDTTLKKAYTKLEEISNDPYLQRIEELKMKKILDDNSVRNHLTEEGRREGRQEGKKEGEKSKSIEIAKNMLKENFDIEVIEKVTGLSKEEIKNIKLT